MTRRRSGRSKKIRFDGMIIQMVFRGAVVHSSERSLYGYSRTATDATLTRREDVAFEILEGTQTKGE